MLGDDAARKNGFLVAFSDRHGGTSKAPYDTLNLAASVGDDPADVQTNRRRFATAAGFALEDLVLARQVHGCDVLEARPDDVGVIGDGDVLVSHIPGKVIGILTADCVPVILAGDGVVAVVHAGWRGLVAGVIEAALDHIGKVEAAWVGPSIHACCYEVGPEVIEAFRASRLPVADDNHVDPGRAALVTLHRAGLSRIHSSGTCTSCDARYFSYRRDGATGRQGAFVGLVER